MEANHFHFFLKERQKVLQVKWLRGYKDAYFEQL